VSRLEAWLAGRSARERTLVLAAAGLTLAFVAAFAVRAVLGDLVLARARVAGHERELKDVRRLAAALGRSAPPTAAGEIVGRERIASMTPESGAVADEERVTLRLTGATLPDTVRLLHALATGSPPVSVTGLTLRKHPDDQTRFDATFAVAQGR
jgi:hypothetical protein